MLVGVEGSPSMGVHITSSDPARGGQPEWPEGTGEHTSGEGIFIEELRLELARRGITPPRSAARPTRWPTTTSGPSGAPGHARRTHPASRLMERRRARSFRVAFVADRYVNPPPGGVDGLAVLAEAGWGVMQLPAPDYPAEITARVLAEVAEQAEEFGRHGYGFVLVGDGDGLAAALAAVGLAIPDQIAPDAAELRASWTPGRCPRLCGDRAARGGRE